MFKDSRETDIKCLSNQYTKKLLIFKSEFKRNEISSTLVVYQGMALVTILVEVYR